MESASLPERRQHRTTLAGLGGLALAASGGPVVILLGRVFARAAETLAGETRPAPDAALDAG